MRETIYKCDVCEKKIDAEEVSEELFNLLHRDYCPECKSKILAGIPQLEEKLKAEHDGWVELTQPETEEKRAYNRKGALNGKERIEKGRTIFTARKNGKSFNEIAEEMDEEPEKTRSFWSNFKRDFKNIVDGWEVEDCAQKIQSNRKIPRP